MPRLLLAIVCFLLAEMTSAQLMDSIAHSLKEPPRFLIKMDNRGSFISSRSASLWGVKVGVEHNKRVQYGIGYSWLWKRIATDLEFQGQRQAHRLRFGYITPFFEYAFFQQNKWEVSIPVQIGVGRASYRVEDSDGNKLRIHSSWVFLYEPAMTVEYRLLKFFGLGLGVGYRLAVKTNRDMEEGLTAPTYMLKLKIYLPDLNKD